MIVFFFRTCFFLYWIEKDSRSSNNNEKLILQLVDIFIVRYISNRTAVVCLQSHSHIDTGTLTAIHRVLYIEWRRRGHLTFIFTHVKPFINFWQAVKISIEHLTLLWEIIRCWPARKVSTSICFRFDEWVAHSTWMVLNFPFKMLCVCPSFCYISIYWT